MLRRLALPVLLLAAFGCDANGGLGRPTRDAGSGPGPSTDGGISTRRDIGPLPDTGLAECSSVNVMATSSVSPIDIVWVIDNSGSMNEEASLIQTNMDSFVSTVEGAGLDVRVVVITRAGFVNVAPSLASDPTRFRYVEEDVQSSNSLEKLLSTFDRWSDFLRRGSQLHFVVVTDDESRMEARDFVGQMQMNLGRTFQAHSVASPPGSTHSTIGFTMEGCEGPHGEAADNGDIYWALSAMTSGLTFSICNPDWSMLFTALNRAVAVPIALPCAYDIPEAPPGEEFDPTLVNVEYTPGSGAAPETLPNVGSRDRCTGEGWYYDDPTNPGKVLLCPNSCLRIEGDAAGAVNVAFGCATLVI